MGKSAVESTVSELEYSMCSKLESSLSALWDNENKAVEQCDVKGTSTLCSVTGQEQEIYLWQSKQPQVDLMWL